MGEECVNMVMSLHSRRCHLPSPGSVTCYLVSDVTASTVFLCIHESMRRVLSCMTQCSLTGRQEGQVMLLPGSQFISGYHNHIWETAGGDNCTQRSEKPLKNRRHISIVISNSHFLSALVDRADKRSIRVTSQLF